MLAVDLALVPHPRLPTDYWGVPSGTHTGPPARLPLDALFVLLGKIGAVGAGEVTLLLAIVFLAGWGMHRAAPARHDAGRYFAGVLYALNPFTYDRLYTGQWFLLLGYALLPWAWRAFGRVLRGTRTEIVPFALLALLVGIASAHMLGLLALLCLVAVVADLVARRDARAAGRAVAGAALAGLASLWWLIPVPGLTDLWRHVGAAQLELYRTVSAGGWGTGATVLGLGGYWNDLDPVSASLRFWPALAGCLVVLAVWGVALRRRQPLDVAVFVAGALGFLLALGHSTVVTRGAFDWLLAHLAVARSFRESQKGVALLVFAYAYLGAAAVDDLVGGVRAGRRRLAVAAVLLALPALLGYRLVDGLNGRLRTSSFPDGWAQARAVLAREAPRSRTLFLPWSGYVELGFAHYRLVANPAPQYFTTPILASRTIAAGAGLQDISDPDDRRVQALLAHPLRGEFVRCLAALGVTHVLLAHEAGAERFVRLLPHVPGLRREQSWPGLDLYRTDLPAGLVMRARGSGACPRVAPVPVQRRSPAEYRLTGASATGQPLVLGLPLPNEWERHGRTVRFRWWDTYRRNYTAGAAALAVTLVLVLLLRRRRRV